MQQKHTIRKFSLELQTEGTEHSYSLQRKCIKMVNEKLVDDIDEILTNWFPAEEIIRINKIEIDLGTISKEELENEFVAKCIAELSSKIKKIPVQQRSSEEDGIIKIAKEDTILEQFFYFLSYGKMTWPVYNIDFEEWQSAVSKVINDQPSLFKEKFSFFLHRQPKTIERLLLQFDEAFVEIIIELYSPFVQKEYEALNIVVKENFPSAKQEAVRRKIMIKLLPSLFGIAKKISVEYIQDIVDEIIAQYPGNTQERIVFKMLKSIHVFATKASIADDDIITGQTVKENVEEYKTAITKEEKKIEAEQDESGDRSVYVSNAGIIILHPFLQNIFKATGLMAADDFKDDASKQKAVHLLQYLSNKEVQAPEYIMPLNKILCGMEDKEHIDRFIELQPNETKEADELLQAVVNHWTTLKNTSTEALQETFFQRNGKLSFNDTDKYWKLQVERKAVDILLDKIPWGISYIKLPWMKYALVTEW